MDDRASQPSGSGDATPTGGWLVRRDAGLLPPRGVTKRIGVGTGTTYLFGVRMGRFDVRHLDGAVVLEYRVWPIRDELRFESESGLWRGRGLLLGRWFCDFRLEPGSQD